MFENLKNYFLDILSVLIPGAMFLLLVNHYYDHLTYLGFLEDPLQTKWSMTLFFATAYFIGHFIFFFSSFLDSWIFDHVKDVYYPDPLLMETVETLKMEKTGIADKAILNAFKWSCAWLLANKTDMYNVVDRYVAESKFFRSLVPVFVFGAILALCCGKSWQALILFLAAILSIIPYCAKRQKSIVTACQFMLTIADKKFDIPATGKQKNSVTGKICLHQTFWQECKNVAKCIRLCFSFCQDPKKKDAPTPQSK